MIQKKSNELNRNQRCKMKDTHVCHSNIRNPSIFLKPPNPYRLNSNGLIIPGNRDVGGKS